MFVVENKFDIGEEVYLIEQIPFEYDCPVCKGEGKFLHNNYLIKCLKCFGSGQVLDNKIKVWVVMEGTHLIHGIKVRRINNINKIKYKVSTFNRSEDNIFKTFEEAEKRCFHLNKGIENTENIK